MIRDDSNADPLDCPKCGRMWEHAEGCPESWDTVLSARAVLAAKANKIASESRRPGAPVLGAHSPRTTLQSWLAWNDPNGAWTDEAMMADVDFRDSVPMSEDDAWVELMSVVDSTDMED